MKLFELAKKHKLNFNDFKAEIQKLGFTEYKGPNKTIDPEDLEKLTEIAESFVEKQVEISAEKLAKRQGRFIGSVFDRKNGVYCSAVISASYRELVEKGVEFEILETHTTIFGAMIQISKKIARFINERTVQKYGNVEE